MYSDLSEGSPFSPYWIKLGISYIDGSVRLGIDERGEEEENGEYQVL